MYGNNHPTVEKGISNLERYIKPIIESYKTITIKKKTEAIFCNEHRIDRILKLDRLIERMDQLQLEFIQFKEGLELKELRNFFNLLTDFKNVADNKSFNERLQLNERSKILINNSAQDSILLENFANSGGEFTGQSLSNSLDSIPVEIRDIFFTSLNNSIVNNKISSAYFQREMKENITESIPQDLYLKYLLNFKYLAYNSDIQSNLSNEKVNKESIMSGINSILKTNIGEIFIKYLKGRISIFTFGAIIKVSFKVNKEISAILFLIKGIIYNEGYNLVRYLSFLEKISWILNEEGLNQMINKLNGEIGLSLGEIRGAIRKSNQSSIPLIILISKLAHNFKLNREKLLTILSYEIEEALLIKCREKLLRLKSPTLKDIKKTLINLEKHVIFQLISGNLNQDLIRDISLNLDSKFDFRIGLLWSFLITRNVLKDSNLSKEEKLNLIFQKTLEQENFSTLYNPLILTLEESGFSKELIESIVVKINQTKKVNLPRVEPKSFTLPAEIKSIDMTKEMLKMEMYRSHRYNTPFSTISITIMGIKTNAGYREAREEEKYEILNQLPDKLQPSLRHLDVIGTLGGIEDDHILLLLPMTDQAGAKIVMQRLQQSFSSIQFTLFNVANHALLLFSTCSMEKSVTDTQKFLANIHLMHEKKADELSRYLL
jgi:hypothetical protein